MKRTGLRNSDGSRDYLVSRSTEQRKNGVAKRIGKPANPRKIRLDVERQRVRVMHTQLAA